MFAELQPCAGTVHILTRGNSAALWFSQEMKQMTHKCCCTSHFPADTKQ